MPKADSDNNAAADLARRPLLNSPRNRGMPGVAHTQHALLRPRHVLPTDALDFELPESSIATRPASPRDHARLMVLSRSAPDRLEHRRFHELDTLLDPGDLLVRNAARVLPARFEGTRVGTGGRVSGLFLAERIPGTWHVMLKSNGRLREDDRIELPAGAEAVRLRLVERAEEGWIVRTTDEADAPVGDPAPVTLERCGATPLPPYILAARRTRDEDVTDAIDADWYQTVYARDDAARSVAAPTAGLHFTDGLLARLASRGVRAADVILDVGAGTFKPIQAETVEAHDIHSESFHVPQATLDALRGASRRVLVGTTTVRTLESLPAALPDEPVSTSTNLLIAPGHQFRWTDALITNFHLPRSSLLALVAAFLEPGATSSGPAGLDRLLSAYRCAIDEGYRFYSYGDAMLILP